MSSRKALSVRVAVSAAAAAAASALPVTVPAAAARSSLAVLILLVIVATASVLGLLGLPAAVTRLHEANQFQGIASCPVLSISLVATPVPRQRAGCRPRQVLPQTGRTARREGSDVGQEEGIR